MRTIAELVKAAILEAWGCGLSGEDVVAFTLSKTGAPAQLVDRILTEMYSSMMRD
jgi:hypothetical protein